MIQGRNHHFHSFVMPMGYNLNIIMEIFKRDELYSLEKYTQIREDFRAKVMQHKQNRRIAIGPHLTLYLEDRLTIQYQIQEMLRVERIFEPAGIDEELGAYNPLIPDGKNLKATMMIEYDDPEERAKCLSEMLHIENQVWLKVAEMDKVYPIADEDLERTTETKTSAVHFLRFEFTDEMIDALRNGAILSAGVDHEAYHYVVEKVPENIKDSLTGDFSK